MDPQFIEQVKRWTIIAVFSDDDLAERLVLKGGNLLDVVHGISTRPSKDIDLSLDGEFADIEEARAKIERALQATFAEHGYAVFDVALREEPKHITENMRQFWGGYRVDFKVIQQEVFDAFTEDRENLRRRAIPVLDTGGRKFPIEISKFEYCAAKETVMLDGYRIQVYTPPMFVCEKLRAICQQMPEYVAMVRSRQRDRSQDFFDIYTVAEYFRLDFHDAHFNEIIKHVFAAKRVPLRLIGSIAEPECKRFHLQGFKKVRDTVRPGEEVLSFDFYFDYLVRKCKALESLWNE